MVTMNSGQIAQGFLSQALETSKNGGYKISLSYLLHCVINLTHFFSSIYPVRSPYFSLYLLSLLLPCTTDSII